MKRILIIAAGLLTAIFLIWSIYVINVNDSFNKAFHNKAYQLDFLKSHEEEIKDYVKSENPKIKSVQIDWDQTQWDEVDDGFFGETDKIINVSGRFNHIEESGWTVTFFVSDDGEVALDSMYLSDVFESEEIFLNKPAKEEQDEKKD